MLQKADVAEVLAAEGQRGRSRRVIRLVAIAGAILVVAALVVWVWAGSRNGGASVYATDTVTRGTITETLVATGTLKPVEQVAIASLVTGTISSVEVDYEEPVRKGQVLARIDPEALAAQLRRAVSAVDAQIANRDAAQALVTDARAALRRA
jgi:HlyD family secretion protein